MFQKEGFTTTISTGKKRPKVLFKAQTPMRGAGETQREFSDRDRRASCSLIFLMNLDH